MSHIFTFICVRGILILVIEILLHSYQGLHSQASNNFLSQQNWSVNTRHISNASKYSLIKNYGGACKIEPYQVSDSWGTGELDLSSYNWIRILIFHSVQWRKYMFIWKPSPDIWKTTVKCSKCQKLLFSEWFLRFFSKSMICLHFKALWNVIFHLKRKINFKRLVFVLLLFFFF